MGPIIGAVLATGNIQIHQDGWRAEEVEILALATRSGELSRIEAVDAVGAILKVPVLSKDDLETYARHFGQTVTKSGAEAAIAKEHKGLRETWGFE